MRQPPLIEPLGGVQPVAEAAPPAAVLLVDDHDLFRAGLRTLLESRGIRVVGDSRCDPGAVDMGRRTRSTVVLIDSADVDGGSTGHLIERFAEQLPDLGVVLFTRSLEPVDIYRAIRAGARGYITKDSDVSCLVDAIDAVRRGSAWLQPDVTATVLEFIRGGNLPITGQSEMSEREIQVLRHLAEGLDNNEIAAQLGISGKTVKNHVSNILMKLQMTNRVQAAVFAVRSGLA